MFLHMKRNSNLKQEYLRPDKVTLQYSAITEISGLKNLSIHLAKLH